MQNLILQQYNGCLEKKNKGSMKERAQGLGHGLTMTFNVAFKISNAFGKIAIAAKCATTNHLCTRYNKKT